jgi:rare lipoprotein A
MRQTGLRPKAALFLALPALAGFAAIQSAGATATVRDTAASFTERGEATWYGPRHEGLKTTSGERFNSHLMTAAHPTLPMGAYVRVTLASNGHSVIVRVNDREPPHGVRCIDLSHEAAIRLGFAGRGVADVTLAQITPEEARAAASGAGDSQELAEAPDDAVAIDAPRVRHASARHGRRHTHHAHR